MVTMDIEKGDLFGTSEMIFNRQRNEKVIVLDDSILISINRETFLESKQKDSEGWLKHAFLLLGGVNFVLLNANILINWVYTTIIWIKS